MMGKGKTRRNFIAQLLSLDEIDKVEEPKNDTYDINQDTVFKKYANKSLPLNKKKSRAGLTPYTGPFLKRHKIHLLQRLMFGATPNDVKALNGLSASQAVDLLLTTGTAPAPPLNYYESIYPDSSLVPYGQTWVGATAFVGTTRAYRIYSLKSWWMENMINQNRSIEEKMIMFLQSHYPIEMYNGPGLPNFHYQYMDMLRTYCLGNLKDFVKALSKSGAMLWYLNGRLNSKTAPDENYARELLELFTVGKEGNTFTEPDVIAAAKVLTGWRTRNPTNANPTLNWESYFLASQHDITTKTFSSYFNNATISPNNSNPAGLGANEVDDLVDMIFNHGAQDTAKLFAKRVYRYFVYYDIDSTVQTSIIDGMAAALISNNWEIKPMLALLFKSDHFFDTANMDCIIKSPTEYFIGMLRTFGLTAPATYSVEERYLLYYRIMGYLKLTGMDIGDPPNASGWPANYQAPFYNQVWINSDTMPNRLKTNDYFLRSAGIYVKSGVYYKLNLIGFVENLENNQLVNVSDPDILVNECVDYFLAVGLSQSSKDYYKSILLSGQSSNYYWTNAWLDYKAYPTDNTYVNIVQIRLRNMFNEMLRLPEHQLS